MAEQRTRDRLQHSPFPELATALRSRIPQILQVWMDEVRRAVPAVQGLSIDEISDHLPTILTQLANVLASANGMQTGRLMDWSPSQGLKRFHQRYDVRSLMTEGRLLRQIIIEQTHAALERPMTVPEQVALNGAVDLMLQQAVIAFVGEQQGQLRTAAEAELKYLSFLSHDLNNNLNSVTLHLQLLRRRLADSTEFAQDVKTLDAAQQSILETVGGMGRLLESERLRKAGHAVKAGPVDLHRLASNACRQSRRQAEDKGLRIEVQVPPDAVVRSDGELITLVLQNLLSNAVKYSDKGSVRIAAERRRAESGECWVVSVSDEGPGIPTEHLDRIFDAFRRGDAHGQSGVGLGLAIASQAAKLLGAELTVESTVGVGSTLHLALPVGASSCRLRRQTADPD